MPTNVKLFVAIAAFLLASSPRELAAADALALADKIPLPDVHGRFDHFGIDPAGQRLFAAALGNNSVEVLDLRALRRLTSINGLRKPTAALFIPERNQIGIAAGGDGVFRVFSGADYQPVTTIDRLEDADNVRLDAATGSVFIGYGEGALAVVDSKTWARIDSIKLPAHPESFQLDSKHIYINVPGAKKIITIDRATGEVSATLLLSDFHGNFPMALDSANHRLFVGCRTPPRLLVINTESARPLANTEISADTDDLFYDAKRQLVYVSCGEGFIDVIRCPNGAPLDRIQTVATRSGARTCYYSAELDRLFLAVPNRAAEPAAIWIYKPQP